MLLTCRRPQLQAQHHHPGLPESHQSHRLPYLKPNPEAQAMFLQPAARANPIRSDSSRKARPQPRHLQMVRSPIPACIAPHEPQSLFYAANLRRRSRVHILQYIRASFIDVPCAHVVCAPLLLPSLSAPRGTRADALVGMASCLTGELSAFVLKRIFLMHQGRESGTAAIDPVLNDQILNEPHSRMLQMVDVHVSPWIFALMETG